MKKVAGFFDRLGAHFSDQIEHLQKRGEFRQDIDARNTGRALAAMVDGIILHRGLFALSVNRHRKLIDASLNLMLANP